MNELKVILNKIVKEDNPINLSISKSDLIKFIQLVNKKEC